jgi:hypothetical protein
MFCSYRYQSYLIWGKSHNFRTLIEGDTPQKYAMWFNPRVSYSGYKHFNTKAGDAWMIVNFMQYL